MGDMVGNDLVLYIGIGALGLLVACGIIGAAVARHRGRGPVKWGLSCLLLGPLGVLVLICLRKVHSHPVWRRQDAEPAGEPDATVSERDTPTLRQPSGNGELRRGSSPLAIEPANQELDSAATNLFERRTTVPEVTPPQAPRGAFEVSLLEPQTTVPDVARPEAAYDMSDASLLEPPTTVPKVAPQAPPSVPATQAPRRGRVPGAPAGYRDFQVLTRSEKKIELQCPNCTAVFRRPNSLMGKLEKCPECRAVMRIPT
jgi:hypothetical protein